MKKILLITSDKVGDTGKVSFAYIFQDRELKAFDKFPEQCGGPFGHMKEIEGGYHFNLFEGGSGFICAVPIYPNREKGAFIGDLNETIPDACSMLCTKAIAEAVKPIFEQAGAQVDILHSEQTLLTA